MTKLSSWSDIPMLQDIGASPEAVKSAARTLRIMEFFDEIRRPARANEISGRLNFPQSSTAALLKSLVKLGYLDFEAATKAYLPSLRTAVLATWRDTGYFRDGSILDMLEDLAAASGLAACLTSRAGIFVRYLHVVQNRKPGDVHIALNVRRYAVRSAAGIALLTDITDTDIRMLVHRTKAEGDPALATLSLAEVMERVNTARSDGHFISKGLVHEDNGAIGIPLPRDITGGWQHMALSLAGRIGQVEYHSADTARAMKRAVAQLINRRAR
ncbi:IclR family transcriptional regulator [Sphingobium sp. YBL2]|uniref:IclR family transcriptional regulator n=1 Tax=Sphingobium sp. (strain YBL2) TaxID=484429 RepID=UPI0009FFB1BB|nr:helix-turn-helix domain-containing protein [Sphingobium sp. YBL2]